MAASGPPNGGSERSREEEQSKLEPAAPRCPPSAEGARERRVPGPGPFRCRGRKRRGAVPSALRVRDTLSRCAAPELFPVCTWSGTWLEAPRLPELGLSQPSLQVRLQAPGTGFRPWPAERGAVPGSDGRSLRGPSGVASTGSGPGGAPLRVESPSLRPVFPFQHLQRRLPRFSLL